MRHRYDITHVKPIGPPLTRNATEENTMTATHAKERIALRHLLLGRGWYQAAEAMEFAEEKHPGLRKDGVTPSYNHQVQIGLYVWTLTPHLLFPEATLTTVFLHDTCEDTDTTIEEIESRFGGQVAAATWAMTKAYQDVKRAPEEVKRGQENDPIASVVKGADRIHNQSTMAGVFTAAKIGEYLTETSDYILPMLKTARRKYPSQDGAYQNERVVLRTQAATLRHFAEAVA
jgi:(p)ppGpp synthase/HD superfamily hydrolase